MDRVGIVFLAALVAAVVVSLLTPAHPARDLIRTDDVRFGTPASFNIGAVIVIAILVVLYGVFW
ncbi:hypothetical protein D3C81_2300930 [compost metagenome]